MKKVRIFIVSLVLCFHSSLLAYSSNPQEFVNELVSEVINKLADKNLNNEQKASFIEKIALESVDINALGLYTLGELRKSASESDITNYQKSFEKYLKSFGS